MNYLLSILSKEINKIRIIDKSIDFSVHSKKTLNFFKQLLSDKISSVANNNIRFPFYDLFCGCGGLSQGLESSGLIPSIALDKDISSLLTYHFNRPFLKHSQIINADIKDVAANYTFSHVPLIVGGPPCQGFSNANKQRQLNDSRNELYKFFVHTVQVSTPDVFLMENVEGILKYFHNIESDFAAIDYKLFPYVLNTKEFGFPQNRKRVFMLGISGRHSSIRETLNDIFRVSVLEYKTNKNITLWDAISDLPSLKPKTIKNSTYLEGSEWGYTFGPFVNYDKEYSRLINGGILMNYPLLNHKSKYNNDRDVEIYRLLKPGEKSDSSSIESINPYLNRQDIFKDKFFKLVPGRICKTITSHMYYDCHMYIHPFDTRGLSPREAARIQGFPDDYLFLGSPNEWYRQIGNAVSPLLSKVLGVALYNILNRIYAN